MVAIAAGLLIADALAAGATAIAKGALGEAGKTLFTNLKDRLVHWLGGDVEALATDPQSGGRKQVLAEGIEKRTGEEKEELATLAKQLFEEIKKAPHPAVDIADVNTKLFQLDEVIGGLRIGKVQSDTFHIGKATAGGPTPGK
ncbi:MAG TPA: hypothetical protein VHS58_17680 [Acetobacteraceae bacterium]|jgi:hypothetical protein|nr:hypothetical protein [Acetobacteraceae bacterium]